MDKRNCAKCGTSLIPTRNPHQSYCSKSSCQNARKNFWRVQKRLKDPDYQVNQINSNKKWLNKKPSYWRDYRKHHPDYTQRNRDQCRHRKQKKRLQSTQIEMDTQFAKSDAFSDKNIIESGTYTLTPLQDRFAKSDALTVKISLIT